MREKLTEIDRKKLLAIVIDNKEKHLKDYKEAVLDRAMMFLNTMKATLKEQKKTGKIPENLYFPSVHLKVDEYDKIIRKLELEEQDTVFLEDDQFEKFVMDNWNWKANFLSNSIMYKSAV
jgi:hypothetical protein